MSSPTSPTPDAPEAAPASTSDTPLASIAPDVLTVTNLIRTGAARTRQELAEHTGMGRNTISALLNQAIKVGRLTPDGSAPSTGGRAPATWRFRHEAGAALVLGVHTTTLRLAVTDLAGNPLLTRILDWPITSGPEATLRKAATTLLEMAAEVGLPVWTAGVSLPGPINQETGRPTAPPIMPGWDDFDVVGTLESLLGTSVVVDNDVNAMLAGYASLSLDAPGTEASPARRHDDILYVQVGTGIGAGLMSGGRLHRGADGAAGDIGHVRVTGENSVVCRCGRSGCLEAVAGGWAVLRDARRAAADGLSPFLRERLETLGVLSIDDVVDGVAAGDTESVTLMVRSATAVGDALAMIVSFFNPARVVVAGPMPQGCPMFLEVARRIVDERALSLATHGLTVVAAGSGLEHEMRGGAVLAVDALFCRETARQH